MEQVNLEIWAGINLSEKSKRKVGVEEHPSLTNPVP